MPDPVCALCGLAPGTAILLFLHDHVEDAQSVRLDIRLCASCGNRIEKHLKRAIPKRLMVFRDIPRRTGIHPELEQEPPLPAPPGT
jgi:hypothetical protein